MILYDDLELQQNQLISTALENAPSVASVATPVVGQVVYDVAIGRGALWTGSAWLHFPTSGGGSGGGFDYSNLDNVTWSVNMNNIPLPLGNGWRITLTTGIDITGIVAAAHDTRLMLFNANAINSVKLKRENTNSLAVNRFALPGDADYSIGKYVTTLLRYDNEGGHRENSY